MNFLSIFFVTSKNIKEVITNTPNCITNISVNIDTIIAIIPPNTNHIVVKFIVNTSIKLKSAEKRG